MFEIDGLPAMEFLRQNIGEQANADPEYPFAVFTDDGSDFYLRAPMGSDPSTGHIVFAGDVPVGSKVRVTEAGRDQILEGARQAVEAAVERFGGNEARALLIFSCAARKQVLGTRCSEEIDLLRSALPGPVSASGFYTYGEIAPKVPGAATSFHNETVVATLIGR